MRGLPEFAYAQTRLQARYSNRADTNVWIRLHNIHDLGSFLQAAQQTPLHPWVLGISAGHSSHDMELALRQKYRQHVDEVTGWLPAGWQRPLQWVKCLADLPVLQFLASGGKPTEWMKADGDISNFTADDSLMRMQAMREAGYAALVDAWQQGDTMLTGWVSHWISIRPKVKAFDRGLFEMQRLFQEQLLQQGRQQDIILAADYEVMADRLRSVFRRYTFQPAAFFAYLAIVALDIHHVRSVLLQRLFFLGSENLAEGLPV